MQTRIEAGRSPFPIPFYTWSGRVIMHIETFMRGRFYSKSSSLELRITCLQYADNTFMLRSPDLTYIKRVKIFLYIFELISRLSINFNKSLLYSLGPPSLDFSAASSVLHCKIESFPFTYFGLPLKSTALTKADWQPLLDRIDKILAAWRVHFFLSHGGI